MAFRAPPKRRSSNPLENSTKSKRGRAAAVVETQSSTPAAPSPDDFPNFLHPELYELAKGAETADEWRSIMRWLIAVTFFKLRAFEENWLARLVTAVQPVSACVEPSRELSEIKNLIKDLQTEISKVLELLSRHFVHSAAGEAKQHSIKLLCDAKKGHPKISETEIQQTFELTSAEVISIWTPVVRYLDHKDLDPGRALNLEWYTALKNSTFNILESYIHTITPGGKISHALSTSTRLRIFKESEESVVLSWPRVISRAERPANPGAWAMEMQIFASVWDNPTFVTMHDRILKCRMDYVPGMVVEGVLVKVPRTTRSSEKANSESSVTATERFTSEMPTPEKQVSEKSAVPVPMLSYLAEKPAPENAKAHANNEREKTPATSEQTSGAALVILGEGDTYVSTHRSESATNAVDLTLEDTEAQIGGAGDKETCYIGDDDIIDLELKEELDGMFPEGISLPIGLGSEYDDNSGLGLLTFEDMRAVFEASEGDNELNHEIMALVQERFTITGMAGYIAEQAINMLVGGPMEAARIIILQLNALANRCARANSLLLAKERKIRNTISDLMTAVSQLAEEQEYYAEFKKNRKGLATELRDVQKQAAGVKEMDTPRAHTPRVNSPENMKQRLFASGLVKPRVTPLQSLRVGNRNLAGTMLRGKSVNAPVQQEGSGATKRLSDSARKDEAANTTTVLAHSAATSSTRKEDTAQASYTRRGEVALSESSVIIGSMGSNAGPNANRRNEVSGQDVNDTEFGRESDDERFAQGLVEDDTEDEGALAEQ